MHQRACSSSFARARERRSLRIPRHPFQTKIDKILYLVSNTRRRKGMGRCLWAKSLPITHFLSFNDKKLFCSYSAVTRTPDITICHNFTVIISPFETRSLAARVSRPGYRLSVIVTGMTQMGCGEYHKTNHL